MPPSRRARSGEGSCGNVQYVKARLMIYSFAGESSSMVGGAFYFKMNVLRSPPSVHNYIDMVFAATG
jgi:hypothetical protein